MSAQAAPPLVDDGRLPGGLTALFQELRPRPERLTDTLRLAALVLAAVTISEVFRLPEPAVSAYVVLFVSRSERSSTVKTALVAGLAVILAVFATIAVFMISLSEPALRVPLIALVTFAAMFFSRISPLGPAAFAAGFIIAYGLTLGDQVLGLSLQSTEISNTTQPGLPELLSIPPEEALLHFLLWLAVVVAMPVGLVVIANLATGARPMRLLRSALAARLRACAEFCAGQPGAAQALTRSAQEGSTGLAKLLALSGPGPQQIEGSSLIRETENLALALLAWPRIAPPGAMVHALGPCAAPISMLEQSVRAGAHPALPPVPAPTSTSPGERPLAAEIARAAQAIADTLTAPPAPAPAAQAEKGKLISTAAARDPNTVRFALKVTLAVMLSYAAESLLDWPEIHTCVVTCFFVSLGTVGETAHKAVLRVSGALIGGALGIATILLLMPVMTDLGDLLLAIAAVTLLAGWVACGSERISYAGWQIGIAYYLTVLQGYGPTLDMQTARDRVIGIILGNLIVLAVFTTLWPVNVAQLVRQHLATALGQLARLMRLDAGSAASRPALQTGFGAATNSARGLMANLGYEPAPVKDTRPIDTAAVAALETIMLDVTVILNLQFGPGWAALPDAARDAVRAYHGALADWFEHCAAWVQAGNGAAALYAAIPTPPDFPDTAARAEYAVWYRTLDADLRSIMGRIMLRQPLIPPGQPNRG